jgi:hypothetical protein
MSAATDKARFFLEKSVPELKEYERKKIFTKVGATAWSWNSLLILIRMKLPLSSKDGPTLSTNSMRAVHSLLTLCDMSSTR